MPLYLVRHAKAGSRWRWHGADEDRPLSASGVRQAAGLAERFRARPVAAVLSSPAVRCTQTVAPLAAHHGLEVGITDTLREGGSFLDVIDLLDDVADGTVLCSHGDLIPEVVRALWRRGVEIEGDEDYRKAATWVLERTDAGFARAYTEPPPEDDPDG